MKLNEFPPLPYPLDALEPFMDMETMNIHYNKHHHHYFEKFIEHIKKNNLISDCSLEQILIDQSHIDKEIRHQGGGFYNHCLFWESMTPQPTKKVDLSQKLLSSDLLFGAINNKWGDINNFKQEFTKKSLELFGSGWVWLISDENNQLEIVQTENQDNPLMKVGGKNGKPLLVLDLWEHAYYLKYKNERDKYIEEWWKVVNWRSAHNKLMLG